MVLTSTYLKYVDERAKVRNPSDLGAEELFLTEYSQCENYSNLSDLYEGRLLNAVKGRQLDPNAPISTIEMLKHHFYTWRDFSIDSLKPRGETLQNSLMTDQELTLSWKQPVIEKVFVPSGIEIREFEITNCDLESFQIAQDDLYTAISTNRSAHFNAHLIPFMMETIKIPAKEYGRLLKGKAASRSSCRVLSSLNDANLIEVPARFIISDGNAFALSLKFGWELDDVELQSNTQQFAFTYGRLQREMRSFLSELPFLYAENVDDKLNCLRRFISDLYDIDIPFSAVDISAIAVAAGCRMDKVNMFTLSVVTTGLPFPVGIDNLDQSWASPINRILPILEEHIYCKFKLLSKIYATMMGSLLRTMFPDPDIVCYALRMSQNTFVAWFSHFVAAALQHAVMHTDPHRSISRADMIRSIIHPDVREGEQLADLLINVPVPQCGGERYLHHARDQFFHQSQIIKFIQLRNYTGDHPRLQEDLLSQRYALMYKRDYVNNDYHLPLESFEVGLQPSPQFKDDIYDFEVNVLTGHVIKDPKFHPERHRIPAIQEWGRLNILKVPILMDKLRKLSYEDLQPFWIEHIRIYDYLRGVILRVRDERLTVFKLDQVITGRSEVIANLLKATEAKRVLQNRLLPTDNILINQERRVNLYNQSTSYLDVENRVGVSQAIHKVIPGDFNKRNRRIASKRKLRLQRVKAKSSNFISRTDWTRKKKLRIIDKIQGSKSPRVLNEDHEKSEGHVSNQHRQGSWNDWVDKEMENQPKDGDFGDDRDIPLKGLLGRISNNSFGYVVQCTSDQGALDLLIRCHVCGEKKLYELWRKLRIDELRNRSKH
jgi:hypothetical protein